jgi:hypothetical protein
MQRKGSEIPTFLVGRSRRPIGPAHVIATRLRKMAIVLLVLAACVAKPARTGSTPSHSAQSPQRSDPSSGEAVRQATIPILPHTTIDPSTMAGKLIMGYQGWFTCPDDDSGIFGWYHWIRDGANAMDAAGYRPDMWPDLTELTEAERCATDLVYPDGRPAHLYTTANYDTVLRHFQWMGDYGIDGVFLQRFGSQLIYRPTLDHRDQLTGHVRQAAETYGRVWAVMFDVTGTDERPVDLVRTFQDDWRHLVDDLRVTQSPSYLRHGGLPVVGLWGLGFEGNPGSPQEAIELVRFFRDNPDPRYRATVVGGVPFLWRTRDDNAQPDRAWGRYYCTLDVISPWTVGAYGTTDDVDFWVPTMVEDLARAEKCGAELMPVVYPGHSYHNPDPSRPFNEIQRQGGRLYWHQVFRAIDAGASMIYNAMFDEIDEGTAMYKIAATTEEVPMGLEVVTADADGMCLPGDWYLTLAGEASRMLRGEIALTGEIPVRPVRPRNC